MERYEKYKDSGIEWLGKIPECWEVKKLKYVANLKSGNNLTSTQIKPSGEYPVYGGNGLRGYYDQFTHEGDFILIGRQGALCGNVNYAQGKFWATDHAVVVQPILEYETIWLGELLHIMNLNQYSVAAAQPGLAVEAIKDLSIPYSPLEEQTAIANYLDRKTTEIDALIAQKERLITLYEEEKTALINHAVTKGIDPDAKLKDSGVDWLGEIPEEWKVKRLRYIGDCKNGVSAGADYFGSGFPFVSYTDVYNNVILPEEVKGLAKSTESDQENYSVEYGDVFFTRTSETVEEIGIASTCLKTIDQAIFAGFLIRFRPYREILYPGYSKYYFRSSLHRYFFVKEMNLVTRASLSQELLKRLPVILPGMEEQKEISNYLDTETAHIDAKIAKAKKIIELQKEYRTALISEVVTGKVKVSHLASEEIPS